MWSGPERSSLNTSVKSSRQALDRMAEQFQSPLANRWLEALVKRAAQVNVPLLCHCIEEQGERKQQLNSMVTNHYFDTIKNIRLTSIII